MRWFAMSALLFQACDYYDPFGLGLPDEEP